MRRINKTYLVDKNFSNTVPNKEEENSNEKINNVVPNSILRKDATYDVIPKNMEEHNMNELIVSEVSDISSKATGNKLPFSPRQSLKARYNYINKNISEKPSSPLCMFPFDSTDKPSQDSSKPKCWIIPSIDNDYSLVQIMYNIKQSKQLLRYKIGNNNNEQSRMKKNHNKMETCAIGLSSSCPTDTNNNPLSLSSEQIDRTLMLLKQNLNSNNKLGTQHHDLAPNFKTQIKASVLQNKASPSPNRKKDNRSKSREANNEIGLNHLPIVNRDSFIRRKNYDPKKAVELEKQKKKEEKIRLKNLLLQKQQKETRDQISELTNDNDNNSVFDYFPLQNLNSNLTDKKTLQRLCIGLIQMTTSVLDKISEPFENTELERMQQIAIVKHSMQSIHDNFNIIDSTLFNNKAKRIVNERVD